MILRAKQEMIDSIPERWKKQYLEITGWMSETKKEVYYKLLSLEVLNEADAVRIIGNNSWVTQWCDECRESKGDTHILFGDKGSLCLKCFNEGARLIADQG